MNLHFMDARLEGCPSTEALSAESRRLVSTGPRRPEPDLYNQSDETCPNGQDCVALASGRGTHPAGEHHGGWIDPIEHSALEELALPSRLCAAHGLTRNEPAVSRDRELALPSRQSADAPDGHDRRRRIGGVLWSQVGIHRRTFRAQIRALTDHHAGRPRVLDDFKTVCGFRINGWNQPLRIIVWDKAGDGPTRRAPDRPSQSHTSDHCSDASRNTVVDHDERLRKSQGLGRRCRV